MSTRCSFTAGSCLWRRWAQNWCIMSDTMNLCYTVALDAYIVAALLLLYFSCSESQLLIMYWFIHVKLLSSGTKSKCVLGYGKSSASLFCLATVRLSLVPSPLQFSLRTRLLNGHVIRTWLPLMKVSLLSSPNTGYWRSMWATFAAYR